ncbi:ECF RNA polymerase sigma factor SigH [Stieleria neptunia]|uniref:RNA polymerase sigma factor SigZ n=1 Tax=Stieleria neptunia TaxID=2527979 RepID=A0A518HJY8_9BACT|nr:RNA polymerase sigma factor SigZ [Stieleria neptunia]QDV41166.1 ECF RNA polymerase sigma factor SigH [Stieleria neptunia]
MNPSPPSVTTEQIWRELSERLRHFVQSRIPGAGDVDDILQNVFLRIHQKFDALRDTERMESWVFQITRNAITDHYRGKRNLTQESDSLLEVTEPSSEGNVNQEVAACIAALIDHLPEVSKRAVSMYELEGFSQAEIARRESISLSGAKSRIQRGRKKLEEILHACCQFQLDTRRNVLECEARSNEKTADCDRCD